MIRALFFLMVLLGGASEAIAHRVSLFAWEAEGRIFTEGRFFGGGRVQGGELLVYDDSGAKLLQGQTNEQGEFSFEAPAAGALRLVLNTPDGHRGEFRLDAPGSGNPAALSTAAPSPLGDSELRREIEAALDRRLNPVLMQIEQERQRVHVQQLVAGLGYIAGLIGIASYVASRRRKG